MVVCFMEQMIRYTNGFTTQCRKRHWRGKLEPGKFREANPEASAYKALALPLSYTKRYATQLIIDYIMYNEWSYIYRIWMDVPHVLVYDLWLLIYYFYGIVRLFFLHSGIVPAWMNIFTEEVTIMRGNTGYKDHNSCPLVSLVCL